MSTLQVDPLQHVETTCGTLLYELQIIWDEVGESESDRDKMLLELEQECLEVYRRKVDQANRSRAQLRQAIADAEAELAAICSAMGERPVHIRQSDQSAGSLKDELNKIIPQLEEMCKRKLDRRNQFHKVLEEIHNISNEIQGSTGYISSRTGDETDLSLRKLEDLHRQLHALQKEKSNRLKEIYEHLNALNSLCLVLGMDFNQTVTEIHPTLGDEGPKSISNNTIEQLVAIIKNLREVKIQRMQKLQDLATTMLELWNLMDTPLEEQQMFQNVTCNIAASEHEVTEPNTLSIDFINHVESEVFRLEELKSSKMKELVLKKRLELGEICRNMHLVLESDIALESAIEALESGGGVDPRYILEQIELQIAKVKEEAFSRKEILDKVEKWLAACDEECWLEEYNRDDNRYNAGRGAHLTLKRAEKARALVNKLPAMVDALVSKTVAWEKEKGIEFTYDGIRLLSMLEEYTILQQEKEQERRRLRDQKKLKGQLIAEQEALYGSKPSPMKPQSVKRVPRMSTGGVSNRRISLGGTMHQTPKPDSKTTHHNSRPSSRMSDRSVRSEQFNDHLDDCFSVLSTGRRGLDAAGLPIRNHSFGEPLMMRKPLSPVSSNGSLKTASEDINTSNSETIQKTLTFNTPSKTTIDDENKTPKVPISLPSTPSTVSVPMQTAMTPMHYGAKIDEEDTEEIEYSFEERRLGFVLPKTHVEYVRV